MGDRVAVMRKGELQQVATPQDALRPAREPLRRRLHRQPGDEHARRRRSSARTATLVAVARRASGSRSTRRRSTPGPALKAYDGQARSSSASAPRTSRTPRSRATPPERHALDGRRSSSARRSARRSWCTSTSTPQPAETDETRELAQDAGDARPAAADRRRRRHDRLVGRFGARSRVSEGEPVEVAVDTRALHFFDPETGLGIYDDDRKEQFMRRSAASARAGRSLALALVRRRGVGATARRRRTTASDGGGNERRLRHDQHPRRLDRRGGQRRSRPSSTAFKQGVPERQGQYKSASDPRRRCSRPRSQGGNPPDLAALPQPGLMQGLRRPAARSSRSTSPRATIAKNFSPVVDRPRHASTASSTASSSRAPTSRPSGTTSTRSRTPASSRRRTGTASSRREDAQGRPACRPTRSAAPTAGRSPTCSRTSTSGSAGPEKYDQLTTHEIPWTDPSVKDSADRDGGRSSATPTNIAGGTTRRAADRLPDLGDERVPADPAEGRDGVRGRLRRRA